MQYGYITNHDSAYGRLSTNSYRLRTIDRIFTFNRPDVFLKHQGVCKKHRGHFSPKGALTITQGRDCLHLLGRKVSLP